MGPYSEGPVYLGQFANASDYHNLKAYGSEQNLIYCWLKVGLRRYGSLVNFKGTLKLICLDDKDYQPIVGGWTVKFVGLIKIWQGSVTLLLFY